LRIQLETTISNGQLLCSIRFHRSHHHLWPNLPHFNIEAPSYSISMQCPLHPQSTYKVSSVNNYCSSSTFKHQLKKYMKNIKPRTWSQQSTFLGLQMSCFLLAKFVIDLLKLSGLALQAIFALQTSNHIITPICTH
jgi:hypothetical protein